jgi:hypothetical protein
MGTRNSSIHFRKNAQRTNVVGKAQTHWQRNGLQELESWLAAYLKKEKTLYQIQKKSLKTNSYRSKPKIILRQHFYRNPKIKTRTNWTVLQFCDADPKSKH